MRKRGFGTLDRRSSGDIRFCCHFLLPVLICISAALSTASPAVAKPLFPGPVLRFNSNPTSLAAGDFNQDGINDLVVVTPYSFNSKVSVLLGRAEGTFSDPVSLAVGATPGSVAVADINGDGRQDIVVANAGDASISLFLGMGDGTFAPQSRIATTVSSSSPVTADFNGDGITDIAVGNSAGDKLAVLLGFGDVTFSAPVLYSTGIPVSIAAGDLNHDGKLDLVTANLSAGVAVLLGLGDGTFSSKMSFPAGAWLQSIALGDLNQDGNLDVAAADGASQPEIGSVWLLLGRGDGTLE